MASSRGVRPEILEAIGLSLLVAAAPAQAAALTSATFIESLSGGTDDVDVCSAGAGGGSIHAPDTIDRNCAAAGGLSSGHAATTGGATPSIVLDLAASAPTGSSGRVDIEYQIAVVPLAGAPVLDFVPVDVSALGNVWVSKTGNYTAYMNAFVFVALEGDNAQAVVPYSQSSLGDEDGFVVNQVLDLAPGTVTTVTMGAQGEVKPWPSPPITGGAEAHAVVDPTFRISADFALRNFFTLQFSPGILPAAEVPLPTTLWLMGASVAACLPRLRRRADRLTQAEA
ncbi:MAG: hypothetical protein KJ054_12910 [Gammaproteobacteria bacterium]|nr:hypothetical protein [Gammaproteobacteria bacterium]